MKWARPLSRAGSHYRSGSACALFPHNSILCVYIRRRAGALAEISARATTILGKQASPPTKRKQRMSSASPVKPASLANRAGSLHINRPSVVWRKHLHACRTKNTNIHKGKCFFCCYISCKPVHVYLFCPTLLKCRLHFSLADCHQNKDIYGVDSLSCAKFFRSQLN